MNIASTSQAFLKTQCHQREKTNFKLCIQCILSENIFLFVTESAVITVEKSNEDFPIKTDTPLERDTPHASRATKTDTPLDKTKKITF